MSSLSTLVDAARRRLLDRSAPPSPEADGRRQFFRRAGALGAAAVGTSLMIPDEAWAGIEERAARFGITPGTVVDAQGKPAKRRQQEGFIGEVRIFAGNFAPRSWAFCNGQLLAISQNTALFSILGTIYGGDGRTTFALPDLRGRVAISPGTGPGLSSYREGVNGGRETVTLTTANLPSHNHSHNHTQPVAGALGTTGNPNGNVHAVDNGSDLIYGPTATAGQALQPTSTSAVNTGGGQGFDIRKPYIACYYIIALQGTYPSRS